MFQFTPFASSLAGRYLLPGGFPHSDICGSRPVCRLPAAFRKLLRPSSPVIAKASASYTYSLDPITVQPDSSNFNDSFSIDYLRNAVLLIFLVQFSELETR